jgi:hypothetical protein
MTGTFEEMEKFFDKHVSVHINSGWGNIKHHKTLENARTRCEKEARQDINLRKYNSEISAISVEHITEQ